MALITFVSAGGSWGTTTAWVGSCLTWPVPVVGVEADPSGGSALLAGYFRGLARPGLSEVVMAHHHGRLVEELPSLLFPAAGSRASFLPGVRAPRQAAALPVLWPALLPQLRDWEETGTDVLVDAGRLGLVGSPQGLIADADVTVVVTGSGLPELAATRAWLGWLGEGAAQVGLVLVGPGQPYSPAEVERDLGVPVVGVLPWEPRAARWWSHGEPCRKHDRTGLAKATVELGERLRALVPAGRFSGELSVDGGGAR